MTIDQLFGLTTYWSYGGGKGIYDPNKPEDFTEETFGFKLHRAFCDNFRFQFGNPNDPNPNGDDRLMVERTPQGWYTDSYLKLLGDNDIKRVWCTQGKLSFQDVQGRANKVNPVDDNADRSNPQSWYDYGHFCRQLAIRYASDTASYLSEAKVFTAEKPEDQWWLSNTPAAGLGLLEAIELGNEWNFPAEWSGAKATLTPREYAVMFKVGYDAIRSVSSEIEIIMGGGLGGREHVYNDIPIFLQELTRLYDEEGKEMPTDWNLCFHWYMRDGGSAQGSGERGATPEEVNAVETGKFLDYLCEEYGLEGWYCTETGWSADYTGSLDTSKNSAPVQEGYSQLESQGILMIRLVLWWSSCHFFSGVTFWHCRDHYDSGPFLNGGVNDPDWEPKPARNVSYDFIDQFMGEELPTIEVKYVDEDQKTPVYCSVTDNGDHLLWTGGDQVYVDDYLITGYPDFNEDAYELLYPREGPSPTPDDEILVSKIDIPGVGVFEPEQPIVLHIQKS